MADDPSTAVVTGANSGIGKSAAELLVRSGAQVVMVCRSEERGAKARAELARAAPEAALDLELADLSDFDSVRRLADRLLGTHERIDVLINNAGVFRGRLERTGAGLERTFATNHLGHFLLTRLLSDPLRAGQARVVNVSSNGHRSGDLKRAPLEEIARGDAWAGGVQAYGDSKLANVLFTFELARRAAEDGITTNALHPGVLATRIWNQNPWHVSQVMRLFKPFMGRAAVGGKAVYRLAAAPELEGVTGRYFHVEKEAEAAPQAHDEELARELWELSERLTGLA